MPFVSLHNHTEYSILDGIGSPLEWAEGAKAKGMPAIAITDHGNMSGVMKFYLACKDVGVKPIIGCEVYIVRDVEEKTRTRGHLVLLAKNYKGYLNLLKLVSESSLRGFYYKPRVDFSMLLKYSKGLIGLSACVQGQIPLAIAAGRSSLAVKLAKTFKRIFNGDFYLELMPHNLSGLERINFGLVNISKELDIPVVVTNDCHYINPEDVEIQDVLLAIGLHKPIEESRFDVRDCHLRGADAMIKAFCDHQPKFYSMHPSLILRGCANTLEIADKCDVEIPHGSFDFPIVDKDNPERLIKELCAKGWVRKFPEEYERIREGNYNTAYYKRYRVEIDTIVEMGYANYFLMIVDLVSWAKKQGIWVGPARGSVAGSLVAYLLGITEVDPLRWGLMFERFLSRSRKTKIPDIDLDFQADRRGEAIEYLQKKWGEDRVAAICTYGHMGAKGAIKDVSKAFDVPFPVVNSITTQMGFNVSLSDTKTLRKVPGFVEFCRRNPTVFKIARRLEGKIKYKGTHAAGVVIAPEPIDTYLPLRRATGQSKGVLPVTQWDMDDAAERGLVKVDILGLTNLQVMQEASDLIREENSGFDIHKYDFNNKQVWKAFSTGLAMGIFQAERGHFRYLLKEIKPQNINELAVVTALVRPGAKEVGQDELYIMNKRNPRKIVYDHPLFEGILKNTYGVLCFQEQVMAICNKVGGISLDDTDLIRDVLAKKKPKETREWRETFLKGAEKRIGPELANKWWKMIEAHAGYSFNLSHAVAYSIISYQNMVMKIFYPLQYMTALLRNNLNSDNLGLYIEEANKMKIRVKEPNVGLSDINFKMILDRPEHPIRAKRGYVLAGFLFIKGIGVKSASRLVRLRDEHGVGKFLNYVSKGILKKLEIAEFRV